MICVIGIFKYYVTHAYYLQKRIHVVNDYFKEVNQQYLTIRQYDSSHKSSTELVVGDLIFLDGDKTVPADTLLVKSDGIQVIEKFEAPIGE